MELIEAFKILKNRLENDKTEIRIRNEILSLLWDTYQISHNEIEGDIIKQVEKVMRLANEQKEHI